MTYLLLCGHDMAREGIYKRVNAMADRKHMAKHNEPHVSADMRRWGGGRR